MTAQAEALRRLSELLPARIRLVNGDYLAAIDHGMYWSQVSLDGSWVTRACLEYALREEIEERGWAWWVLRAIKTPYYEARVRVHELNYQVEEADTAVLALSLALIAILSHPAASPARAQAEAEED